MPEDRLLGLQMWQFGLLLITLNTFTTAVGLLFFKRSSDLEAHLVLWCRWRFWAGFFFTTVVLSVTDSIAYSLTPLSLIAPLAGLTMIWSALLAATGCFGFRELLTKTDVMCIFFVLTGVTLISTNGTHADDDLSLDVLRDDFYNPVFIVFASFSVLVILSWLAINLLPVCQRFRPDSKSVAVTFGCAYSAAACGSLTQVFMKIISTTIRVSFQEGVGAADGSRSRHFWREPLFYISLCGLVSCGPAQLYLLNSTLASSSLTFAVPAYQSLIIILTIASGGIFFNEFSQYDLHDAARFLAAVMLVMVGLAVLSHQHKERVDAKAHLLDAGVPGTNSHLSLCAPSPADEACHVCVSPDTEYPTAQMLSSYTASSSDVESRGCQ